MGRNREPGKDWLPYQPGEDGAGAEILVVNRQCKEVSGGRGVWERQYNRKVPKRLHFQDTVMPRAQGQTRMKLPNQLRETRWSLKQQWEAFADVQRHVGDKPHKICKVAVILVPLFFLGQGQCSFDAASVGFRGDTSLSKHRQLRVHMHIHRITCTYARAHVIYHQVPPDFTLLKYCF